jgi:hypothetical protein
MFALANNSSNNHQVIVEYEISIRLYQASGGGESNSP